MPSEPRLDLSLTQVLASALAAITATLAASYFGVTGTVIGAALASVLTVTGNAVYGHSLRRTGNRVRDVVPVRTRRAAPGSSALVVPATERGGAPATATGRRSNPSPAWRRMAVASAGVFAAVLAAVTGVEMVTGRPVSTIVRGDAGSGTTVFGTSTKAPSRPAPAPAPAPTVTRTVTPSVVVVTPTVTRTAAPTTRTTTPTATPTPATPTAVPTAAPTGSTGAGPATSPAAP